MRSRPCSRTRSATPRSGTIPLRRTLAVYVANGYAAVGDSAAMTEPMSGSGITLSMKAGKILADVVIEAGDADLTVDRLWPYEYRYAREMGDRFVGDDLLIHLVLSLTADDIALWFQESLTCNAADSTADVDGLTTENAVTLKATSGSHASSGYLTTAAVEYGITRKCFVNVEADTPTGTSVAIETSTSDDLATWSDWAAPGTDNTVQSDSAKYIKFRVTLTTTDSSVTPTVRSIALATPGESAFKKLTIQARSRWR